MDPVHSNSPPTNPQHNQIWIDTSTVPNRQFRWNGSAWISIAGAASNHSDLGELDYASAGHTGFAPERHPHFLSELEGINDVLKQIEIVPELGDPIIGSGLKSGAHIEISVENDTQHVRIDAANVAPQEHPHEMSDITGLGLALSAKENRNKRGQPDGYAPLDGAGKVPVSHIPSSVFGGSSVVPAHPHPNYAEKDVLSHANGAQTVHFTNLRGVPVIGHGNYKAPVEFSNQLPPSNNDVNDIRFVSSEGLLYWWAGLEWRQVGFLNMTHSELNGNGADDHLQYFNEARGDLRYYTKSSANTTFATKSEVNELSLESSLQQTFPLLDDQSSAIGTGYTLDLTTYRGSSCMYMIERGVNLVFGSLNIAHMTSVAHISEARDVLTSDVGITFTASISGDSLILNYASTSTGEDATFRICEKVKFYL